MAKFAQKDASPNAYHVFLGKLKQNELGRLYYFYGPERFLLTEAVKQAKKSLIAPEFEDFNYMEFSAAPTYEEAAAFVMSMPLFGDKKLLVFKGCSLFDRQLTQGAKWGELMMNLPEYMVVIIDEGSYDEEKERKRSKTLSKSANGVETAVKTMGSMLDFEYLPRESLIPWIVKGFSKMGKSISSTNAAYMLSKFSDNGCGMSLLRSEIDKVAAAANEFVVEKKDIDSVIAPPLSATVFKLIDALFNRRRDLCYKIASELDALKQPSQMILPVLSSQVLSVYKAKVYLAAGVDYKKVCALTFGWQGEKAARAAKSVDMAYLASLVNLLRQMDSDTKNGVIDPDTALSLIIAH